MKKLFLMIATAAMIFAGGCTDEYDDTAINSRVDNLEGRVAKLEELCKQMNTNISSLQTLVTALQNNDYVTSVTPVVKAGETIGYTISFTKSAPITIYHGENGNDGDSFFQSVTQDEDNIYFTMADGTKITLPKKPRLAISFAEGTSLQFDVDETKTVNYTITGGGNNNVVKAEMQNLDGSYTLYTTSTSATRGSIKITANIPTKNRVIVSVSDGSHTIMAAIDVTLKASFDGSTVVVETPGTLASLIADYDKTTITELTVIGNLNNKDISTLKSLPNLAILDMENVNLEELPGWAFSETSLTTVKLPKTLKTIGKQAFYNCSSLSSVTIGNSVTTIGIYAFSDCNNLTSIYCKAQIPPTIEHSTTFSFVPTSCIIYVPLGCREAYTSAAYWNNFRTIIEMEF